jgi:D-alanine-D-alanine ligase
MRAKRVLLITHEDLVPPENIDDLTEAEVHEIRTEYDVYSTMYNLGHKVRVLGIGDRVSDLRETIRDW